MAAMRDRTDGGGAGALGDAPRGLVDPDREANELARDIAALARRTALEFSYRVGEMVVDRFYAGDPTAWRSRARKDRPLRVLARQLDRMGAMSATTLYRCLALFSLLHSLGGVSRWKHLSASHVRAVLTLDASQQRALLLATESEQLTVRELEARVDRMRSIESRQARPKLMRAVRKLDRVVSEAESLVAASGKGRALRSDDVEDAFGELILVRERLEKLQKRLSPKRWNRGKRTE